MFTNDSDRAWEQFGKKEPYFGVRTDESFRSDRLNAEAKEDFFDSGRRYVDFVVSTIRENLDPSFAPARGVDFGCGVGRLAIPLARVCESVTGVDVSESMLAEAAKNAREQNVSNVQFVKGDDRLSALSGAFDFVHSFIVFQHIPRERGGLIFQRLIDLLREGGTGALHVTYEWSTSASLARRLLTDAYERIPFLYGIRNLLKGQPFNAPMMQMNRYDLNQLLRILQESGCHRIELNFTETQHFGSPFYGVTIFFRKKAIDVRAHA
jgi:SAM-dependent methyltransferase